jgi:hypothetical protein
MTDEEEIMVARFIANPGLRKELRSALNNLWDLLDDAGVVDHRTGPLRPIYVALCRLRDAVDALIGEDLLLGFTEEEMATKVEQLGQWVKNEPTVKKIIKDAT